MQLTSFKTSIEQYSFSKDGINEIKNKGSLGEDWPVVYILSGDKETYIGETQSAYDRMNQHYLNPKRRALTKIHLMLSDSFNKSAILDIENMLITHMHADGKFILQNGNGGQSKLHNYYQRSQYQNILNYCGVIFGKDISYNPETEKIEYHFDEFIDTYSKSKDKNKTIKNIINAYLVLLTRGVYGTYI